jgi:ketosteroid isomerase-like protein
MTTAIRDIEAALERLNALVGSKDMGIVHAFDEDADVLLVGSETDEVIRGKPALTGFFEALFAQDLTIGWNWTRLDAGTLGNVLWFFAEGHAVLDHGGSVTRKPYRLSGVLVRRDGGLHWRLFHGSEPQ